MEFRPGKLAKISEIFLCADRKPLRAQADNNGKITGLVGVPNSGKGYVTITTGHMSVASVVDTGPSQRCPVVQAGYDGGLAWDPSLKDVFFAVDNCLYRSMGPVADNKLKPKNGAPTCLSHSSSTKLFNNPYWWVYERPKNVAGLASCPSPGT